MMERLLTVADRAPKPGDTLAYEGKRSMPYEVIETTSVGNLYTILFGGARKTIMNVLGGDTYISRADGGPVTAEKG